MNNNNSAQFLIKILLKFSRPDKSQNNSKGTKDKIIEHNKYMIQWRIQNWEFKETEHKHRKFDKKFQKNI